MIINGHAHVFNLRSILTKECVRIFRIRAGTHKFGNLVLDGLDRVLEEMEETSDPDVLAVIFGNEIAGNKYLRDALKKAGVDNTRISAITSALREAVQNSGNYETVRASLQILDAILGADPKKDWQAETIGDFLDFLRLGLLPSIDTVTDELMFQMRREDAVVALMMDILGKKPLKRDLRLFLSQVEDTSRQIFRYPGRILPFVKANSDRNGHGPEFDSCLDVVKKAIMQMGFVGVKMYPSLGYDLKSVQDVIKFCADPAIEAPILFHCNKDGFKGGAGFEAYAEPKLWDTYLKKYPTLRVCFAHFGGDEEAAVSSPSAPSGDTANWTNQILLLMEQYPGQVYTDISYNTVPMDQSQAAADYLTRLKAVLANPLYRPYVLYGTDYFLVRQRVRDRNYEAFYRQALSVSDFDQIARVNPLVYLGVEPKVSANIKRYLSFLATPHQADWSMAGGILLGCPSLLKELNTLIGSVPMWNPGAIACQAVVAKLLYGQLSEPAQKEVKKSEDRMLRLGDYRVMHLASYGGKTDWRDALSAEVAHRLKKAGCRPVTGSSGWQDIIELVMEWSEKASNSIAVLGVSVTEKIQ